MRRALVTGSARGIGAAIAERLRSEGFDVVGLDREPGQELHVDLARGALDAGTFGGFDVVVSNAGITSTIAPAHSMRPEQWQRDVDVNLTGAFRVIQACLPGMRERRYGRIVVISSGAALAGLPGQVAYAASKAGLHGMVKTIAAENVRRGITANVVVPGMIGTEQVLAMPEEVRTRAAGAVPMRRFGAPAEIAHAVAFFASEEAGYATGQELAVDGGMGLNTMSLGAPDRE